MTRHEESLHTVVQELADRAEITDLVHRLTRDLDEHDFDDLSALFTDDVAITTPGGTAAGPEAVVAQATRNHEEFTRLQHNASSILIDLDGDRAAVRSNLVGVFGYEANPHPVRVLGAVNTYEVVRTDGGWRIARLEVRSVWRAEHLVPVA
jgi:3-phenylpropionate/cinnamic acid dioxygenase small subunit